jgi:GDP-L-fucose synthase
MKKITIFGSSGLLGSEVMKSSSHLDNVFGPLSSEVDLLKENSLEKNIFNDLWINCAARVGGVQANTQFVSDFFQENMKMGVNVLHSAHKLQVKKVVSVLSTCIYPDATHVNYPLTEDQLHNGPPHVSNFGYAYAKRMLDVQSRAYRQQYGDNFITVVPNNLYGPQDNYDLNSGHVIPSLIRKFFEASQSASGVVIWGSGKPIRDFTFARDAAAAIWWCAENYNGTDPINIGCTEQISIGDLAQVIGKIMSFKGQIKFDSSKPDGQFKKPSSNAKLRSLGYDRKFCSLEEGLSETIEHFSKNYPFLRGIK